MHGQVRIGQLQFAVVALGKDCFGRGGGDHGIAYSLLKPRYIFDAFGVADFVANKFNLELALLTLPYGFEGRPHISGLIGHLENFVCVEKGHARFDFRIASFGILFFVFFYQ